MDIREKFRLKVHESNGAEYQKLFAQIMTSAISGFQSVKPHGNIGDRGNDGWIKSTGTYYQVYAPEDLPKNTETAIKKAKDDYKKLNEYWNKISKIQYFYLVLNDQFHGVSPHISKVLQEIRTEFNLIETGAFGAQELERTLFTLPHDVICSILGVSQEQLNPLYDDQKKARQFLDKLSVVFDELFTSGRTAGYFFPSNVFYFIRDWTESDWNYNRLLSRNAEISRHQNNIRNQLINMHNQVIEDSHYKDIGLSFKYMPPQSLKNRDKIIEKKQDSMLHMINSLADSYKIVRNYSA